MVEINSMTLSLRQCRAFDSGEVGWAVIAQQPDGIEIEVGRYKSRESAEKAKDGLQRLRLDSAHVYAVYYSLCVAQELAHRISVANDQQGTAGYATKAHMASWAERIEHEMLYAIALFGGALS